MYYESQWVRAEAEMVYYFKVKYKIMFFESAFIRPSSFLLFVAFAEWKSHLIHFRPRELAVSRLLCH